MSVNELLSDVHAYRHYLKAERGMADNTLLAYTRDLERYAGWVADVRAPGTRDRVLDFVTTQEPAGSRILTDVPQLAFDGARYEAMEVPRLTLARRLQVLLSDYVVVGPQAEPAALAGLDAVFEAEPLARVQGPRLAVYAVGRGLGLF